MPKSRFLVGIPTISIEDEKGFVLAEKRSKWASVKLDALSLIKNTCMYIDNYICYITIKSRA